MIPGVDLVEFIKWGGVIAVALVIFAESGLLIGFFLPGDSLLFTAGFLTYAGILPVDINLLVVILFCAAVLGDNVGYLFGKKVGPALFNRPDSRFFKKEHLHSAHEFYEKHGGITIVLARFIPIVRTFAPVVAGTAKMNYRSFVFFNIIGGFLWAVGLTYTGYFLGQWFTSMGLEIDHVLLPIILLIIFLSILPPAIHILKDGRRRKTIVARLKRLFKT